MHAKILTETSEGSWLGTSGTKRHRPRSRGLIRERSRHIEMWESSQENGWNGDLVTRTDRVHLDTTVKIECIHCGKECAPRAGLAIHMKRMHSQIRTNHTCTNCNRIFSQKANLKNHETKCQGKTSHTKHVRTLKDCPYCHVPQAPTNFRRHIRNCGQQMGTPAGEYHKKKLNEYLGNDCKLLRKVPVNFLLLCNKMDVIKSQKVPISHFPVL